MEPHSVTPELVPAVRAPASHVRGLPTPLVVVAAPAYGPSLQDCAADWLARHAAQVRPQTVDHYAWLIAHYVAPWLGARPIAEITTAELARVFAGLARRQRSLSPATLRAVHTVLVAVFRDALGEPNAMRDVRRPKLRRVKIQPVYDERQLETFLRTSSVVAPHLTPLFLACGRAGLRIGEALGLKTTDPDFVTRKLRVERTALDCGRVGPPKNGYARVVDMSASLARALEGVVNRRGSGYLFPGRRPGTIRNYTTVLKAMKQVATVASLPYCSPHMLRHAAASILIARGVSPDYVSRQLGHLDLTETIRTYGRHLPFARPAALDEL